jgi:hypothetical protein
MENEPIQVKNVAIVGIEDLVKMNNRLADVNNVLLQKMNVIEAKLDTLKEKLC